MICSSLSSGILVNKVMQIVAHPPVHSWASLTKRPSPDHINLLDTVRAILDSVRLEGDEALRRFSKQFSGVSTPDLVISQSELEQAANAIDAPLRQAIEMAISNVQKFHFSQISQEPVVEISKGVSCWRKSIPIERVGLYIPGGSAPLFSTLIMLAVPAKIAGCKEIVICSPPQNNGCIHPAILFVAHKLGCNQVYKTGGAQAIAAMAYGTESIPQVFKIFGPGNRYVTAAKLHVASQGVAIDMPAGPSELMVVADDSANASFVAADLLSQAEHGPDSQTVLVSASQTLIKQVVEELNEQILTLPRREIAQQSMSHSLAVLLSSKEEVMDFANLYAPEHLILAVSQPELWAQLVVNAGSVFLGQWSTEALGDYASGTNHTLPTAQAARAYSGVSLDSFVKKVTFQNVSEDGLRLLGPAVSTMAQAEELEAHRRAVEIRLSLLK